MQTILISTDFQNRAFNCIPSLCNQFEGKELSLVFTHMFKLSDSESDLLMLARRAKEFEAIPEEFYRHCYNLKSLYPQIKHVKIEFFYGSTLIAFKNFLQANCIDSILDTAYLPVGKINKLSVNPELFVQKSGYPIIRVYKATNTSTPFKTNRTVKEELTETL